MESQYQQKQSYSTEKHLTVNSQGTQTIISIQNNKRKSIASENHTIISLQDNKKQRNISDNNLGVTSSQSIFSSPRKKRPRKISTYRKKSHSKHHKSSEPDYEGMIHAFLLEKYLALGTMNYMDNEEPKEDEY